MRRSIVTIDGAQSKCVRGTIERGSRRAPDRRDGSDDGAGERQMLVPGWGRPR